MGAAATREPAADRLAEHALLSTVITAAQAATRPLVAPLPTLRERQLQAAVDRAYDNAEAGAIAVAGVLDILPDTLHEADLIVLLHSVGRLIKRSRNVQRTVAGCDLDIDYSILVLDEREEDAVAEREAEAV